MIVRLNYHNKKKPSNNLEIQIRFFHQIFNTSTVSMYKGLVTSDVMSKFIQGIEYC